MRLGEQEVIAPLRAGRSAAVGERVTLGVDMAKACLFDPANRAADLTVVARDRTDDEFRKLPQPVDGIASCSSPAAAPASAPRWCAAFAGKAPRSRSSTSRPKPSRDAGGRARRRAATSRFSSMRPDRHRRACAAPSIDTMRDELGPIAVLVNNAANDDRHDIDDVTPDYWDGAMNVNLRHQFFAAQAVHPHMRSWATARSSISPRPPGCRAAPGSSPTRPPRPPSSASPTRSAREFGADDIRVNAIAPGAVVTERQLRLWYTRSRPTRSSGGRLINGAAPRRDRPDGAVPRRRRQPHDHQAVSRRRRGHALSLAAAKTSRCSFGKPIHARRRTEPLWADLLPSACRATARRAPIRTAAASKGSSRSPTSLAPGRWRSSSHGWRR